MKKIFLLLLLFLSPYAVHADLDIFLSSEKLPYSHEAWTSHTDPDPGSSHIYIESLTTPETFPDAYVHTPEETESLIKGLFSSLTETQQQERYDSLVAFSTQNLLAYLAIALSPNTENDISEKASAGFQLSPFESVFQSCPINITQRQNIIRALIDNIHSGTYTSVKDMQYSDMHFGDCIIPFPDVRRSSSVIADSFPSNKIRAQNLAGNPLDFGTKENDIDLVSFAGIDFSAQYENVQNENLHKLSSTRIVDGASFEKKVGKNNILFLHENIQYNPFLNNYIKGNRVAGKTFDSSHDLFIQADDSETRRSISPWQEIRPGIYTKTILQEDTFETLGSEYIPKQRVGASRYYAISYHYDDTPPFCERSIFSHDSAGENNFIIPENPWFYEPKYGYFLCGENESSCLCDGGSGDCFSRDERIFTIPQFMPHNNTVSQSILNLANVSHSCESPSDKKILYDYASPDILILTGGLVQNSLTQNYVSNHGILYNGIHIPNKKMYHIQERLSFPASDEITLSFNLQDSLGIGAQGISGLHSYQLQLSQLQDGIWQRKGEQEESFSPYNSSGAISMQDTYVLTLSGSSDMQDIFRTSGSYQLSLDVQDFARNHTRVILYFDIIPGPIDVSKSILNTTGKNTLYADNASSYTYTLSLKDSYGNPIAGRNVSGAQISCSGISDCKEVLLNMSGTTPSGGQAFEIHTIESVSDTNGEINFSLRSKSPGEFSEGFQFNFLSPNESHVFVGETNSFLAPFEGVLETKDGANWLDDKLFIGSEAEYRLKLMNKASMSVTWALNNFSSFLVGRHPDTAFSLSGILDTQSDGVYFNGTFTSSLSDEESHKTLLEIVDGSVSGVIISYILGGENVRYRLHANHQNSELLSLGNTGELENPVKIIGQLQGVGNSQNLNERQNFTDLNSNELRNAMRKNIEKNIAGRVGNSDAGGIKYVDKTEASNKLYTLPSNPHFETLIVRNGNIHISSDFNNSKKKVGIISYNDRGYNKETGYSDTGNIYIEDTVSTVNAFIYADGALISTKSESPIEGNVNARIDTKNSILPNQLKISGALFSRNTLAGGRELAGAYMLPGEEKTTNRALAVQYDLYYTRRGNAGCETDAYDFCNIPHYMIIEYDTRVQSSPPKLFQTGQ